MVRKRLLLRALLAALLVILVPLAVYAAVGCRLNNPDQDIKRLHPDSSNYRRHFIRIDERGGEKLYRELEKRLGDKWDPNWETADIPYAFYEVLKGPERIGWVFGGNQGYPGADNAQVIIATDLNGRIKEMFLQKLPSLEKSRFQRKEFYGQFVGLTLEHFYLYEALAKEKLQEKLGAYDMAGQVKDPSEKEREGFLKLLRGVKKILVNFDEFWLENRVKKNSVFEKAGTLAGNKDKVPVLEDPLAEAKKYFKDAARVVSELPAPADKGKDFVKEFWSRVGKSPDKGEEDGKLPLPVLLVYSLDNYDGQFVRGGLLGYLALVPPEGGGSKPAHIVAVDARGKVAGVSGRDIEKTGFSDSVKNLSLREFYINDAFTALETPGGKHDRISGIKKDFETALLRTKKALVLLDEFYMDNRHKKEKVFEIVRKFIEKQKEGGEK